MTAYITEFNGADVEGLTEESTPFGVSFEEHLSTTMKKMAPISLKGIFDDTASTGPDVVFNVPGGVTTRTLGITWGGTKITTVETLITNYKRSPTKGALTKYEVNLLPTGTITEA